jgi:hypothetical protein
VLLLFAVASIPATSALAGHTALPRTSGDRADDVAGPQIHIVYAVPADGQDRNLDAGVLEGSVGSFQAWLRAQTGGKELRLDTFERQLDVTFVRLTATDAQLAARGPFVVTGIEQELRSKGFTAPGKIYAVYYDGSSTYACGGAFWPPLINGNVVAMYLRGAPPGVQCDSGFVGADDPPGYWEYAMLHDILHGLGFVPACAPNHHRTGHVTSPNNDLMWTNDTGFWTFPLTLDVGRDDYYGHGRQDCPDLARSPYLVDAPQPPTAPKVLAFATTQARAGRPFRAELTVDTPVSGGACVGRVGTQRLRGTRRVSDATVSCSWQLPRSSRGRRVAGSVTATTPAGTLSRSFSRRIR